MNRQWCKIFKIVWLNLCFATLAFCGQTKIDMHLGHIGASVFDKSYSLQVSTNQAFMLTISIQSEDLMLTKLKPEIPGLENFNIGTASQGGGYSYQNNEVVPIYQFHYYLEPKTSGNFKIGPAVCRVDREVYQSNSVQVSVNQSEKLKDFFVTAEIVHESFNKKGSSEELYVGQKAFLDLKIYINTAKFDIVDNFQIQKPESEDLEILDLPPSQSVRNEYLDRKTFKVAVCRYQIVPLKAGVLQILPFKINCEVAKRSQNFGFMNMFFPSTTPVSVSSNDGIPLGIEVKEIPDNVQAVGSDFAINLGLEKQRFMQGEPITLMLNISGNGDFEKILHPELTLPNNLRAYEAKSGIIPATKNFRAAGSTAETKRFEYTLQAAKTGIYKIPPQTFLYFDTAKEKVVEIKSNSLSFAVTANPKSNTQEQLEEHSTINNPTNNIPEESKINKKKIAEALAALGIIDTYNNQTTKPNYPIHWRMLLIILLVLLILFFWQEFYGWAEHTTRQRIALFKAKLALKQAKNSNNLASIYYIFLEYFSNRFSEPQDTIDFEWIEIRLTKIFSSKILASEFCSFFNKAAGLAFGKIHKNFGHQEIELLFHGAKKWLETIESKQQKIEHGGS